MKKLSFYLVLFFLVSCGTLRSPKNVIPIDSSPRGVQVYNDEKLIGVTPFFYEAKRAKTHKIEFRYNKKIISKEYKCSLNWDQSILPTSLIMLLYPAGTIFGGVGLSLDGISGGLYKCHSPLFAYTSFKFENTEKKKKVIMLPIENEFQVFSKEMLERYKRENLEIEFLDDELIWTDLFEYGINHFKDNHPSKIQRYFLNQIASKHGATHFYYTSIQKNKQKYIINTQLYDAYTLKIVEGSFNRKYEIEVPENHDNNWLKSFGVFFNIIPNGFRLSQSIDPKVTYSYNLNGQVVEKEAMITKRHPKAFPKFISSINLESILHPQDYKMWDITGSIFPTVSASSWMSEGLGDGGTYSAWIASYYFLFNGELTVHTPIGALSAGAGYGYSLNYMNDSLGSSEDKVLTLFNINLNYVAFLTRSIYLKLAIDAFEPKQEGFGIGNYKVRNWSQGSIGLGYYFPSLRHLARDLLDF
ncbi:hypothetical protein [Halobacteriovorax sp. HLS]|uniref:hypothetical protein n=1 Tax=Halobacteriovorax sp. HLS TaxID=2234000 RepID=UPI000FDC0623|nr:hypothetical protein [Halobacteriovorax sp. HLS]